MKLLFIEDSRPFFHWLTAVMPHHECYLATNVEEMLRMFQEHKFDAVFVDLKIPGVDEVKMVSAAKGLADGVPVIILTGEATRADLCRVADMLLFKHMILSNTERVIEECVEQTRQYIASQPAAEQTNRIFSAIGGLRHGVPA